MLFFTDFYQLISEDNSSPRQQQQQQETMVKKGAAAAEGKKKKKSPQAEQPPQNEGEDGAPDKAAQMEELQQKIVSMRERGKEDPEMDYLEELREVEDKIAELMGKEKRPRTAKPGAEESEEEEEEEEEEEDPDKEVKELINKRLTSCMLLALSFESEDSYPEDFYEKLKESAKLDEVTTPITKEEMKILNTLLKEKKPEAKKRVKKAGANGGAAAKKDTPQGASSKSKKHRDF